MQLPRPPRLPGVDPLDVITSLRGQSQGHSEAANPAQQIPIGDIARDMRIYKPREKKPKRTSPLQPGEMGIYMRERGKTPVWLKAHQEKFTRARKQATIETADLHGVERVMRGNELVRKYILDPNF